LICYAVEDEERGEIMIGKILRKDISKNKIITVAVFMFIMLAALLIASGTNLIIDLTNSLAYLFEKAEVPHYIQYHSGEIDQEAIMEWAKNNGLVKEQQTSTLINIEGSKIYLGDNETSEADTIMDLSLVKQNEWMDFLLNLNNEKIHVEEGEIAVPIVFMEREGLEIGDKIVIKNNGEDYLFTISDFVRDAMMNPSIVSSKRFVISEADFEVLREGFGEIEYLICFRLKDIKDINLFSNEYEASNLPKKGTAIDYELLKVMNSITDGLVVVVIMLMALLLNLIALLCLRFTILATIEEEYRQVGIMKAIGIQPKDIRRIHMAKYFFIALIASITGYVISIFFNTIFSANLLLYMGVAPQNSIEKILPFLMVMILFIMVVVFCLIIMRRLNKISALEAIRQGNTSSTNKNVKAIALYKSRGICPNIFIGLRDVIVRFRLFILLFIVFVVCTFIMTVPFNFLNTIQSPEMVTYMGMGKSDLLIDLRQSDNIIDRYDELVAYIEKDSDIISYSPLITCRYEIINNEGYAESLTVETGDFGIFPVEYLYGFTPELENEIALSYLSARELQKQVGDTLELMVEGEYRTMIVTGIYQDITNGGRTAKADIEPDHSTAMWYMINANVVGDIEAKIEEYEIVFHEAKITDIKEYFEQTFGSSVKQLKLLAILSISIAVMITFLITSMSLKMLMAKDSSQIAIMRAIGISMKDIQKQYITRSLIVLNAGIIVGTIVATTLGEGFVSTLLAVVGVSKIDFVINGLYSYVISPLCLMAVVTVTTLLNMRVFKEFNRSDINVE
jgi:putative ABC transport system permease protein